MQKKMYLLKSVLLCTIVLVLTRLPAAAHSNERFSELTQSMEVVINDDTYNYFGTATTTFINATGDTLRQLFYHAYFNAFDHGSAMDAYAEQNGDTKITSWIAALQPHQTGRLNIDSGRVNNQTVHITRTGTIIHIDPAQAIAPGDTVRFNFSFSGQIPYIIRRAGRNNAQGIRYSMAQWYPKLCQYDDRGWHNNQYVGKEFYGVFGRYDVRLTLPARYVVGATGELQNPTDVGHGYQYATDTTVLPPNATSLIPTDSLLTWHFVANNVHDFAWVADEDYRHTIVRDDSLTIHLLYTASAEEAWQPMPDWCRRIFRFFGAHYGSYPYRTFTCSQAGDGGMEYPQLVMLTDRSRYDLVRVAAHEIGHQWFYGMVANNETQHAWLDEGFTNYIESRVMTEEFADAEREERPLLRRLLIPELPQPVQERLGYERIAAAGLDEPLTTPHDRFNDAYTTRIVYDKGMALLQQFEYSFGRAQLDSCLRRYALLWRFRHPSPQDFENVCEEVFGQRLDEVFDTFIATTHRPEYALCNISSSYNADSAMYHTVIDMHKDGIAHVPLTLYLRLDDGSWTTRHIPSDVLYHPAPGTLQPWFWTHSDYRAEVYTPTEIAEVRLDTTNNLLDPVAENNYIHNRLLLRHLPPIRFGLWQRYDLATPLDYYGISLRPTLWYMAPNNWQPGLRLDGLIDANRYKTSLGLYYNTASQKVDWQTSFSHPFALLGNLAEWSAVAWSMDGSVHAGLALTKQYRDRYTAPQRWELTAITDYWKFTSIPLAVASATGSDFYRILGAVHHTWKDGSLHLSGTVAGTEQKAGAQWEGRINITLKKEVTHAIKLRLFASTATPLLPTALLPSLHTANSVQRFGNVPYRFVSGALIDQSLVFLPGGGGFAGTISAPMRHLASVHIALREWYPFRTSKIPVVEALESGLYTTLALGGNRNLSFADAKKFFYSEAGILAGININALLPYASALWLFTDELSATVWVPLYKSAPDGTVTGTRDVRLGISSAL